MDFGNVIKPTEPWGTPANLKGTVVFPAQVAFEYFHGSIVLADGDW